MVQSYTQLAVLEVMQFHHPQPDNKKQFVLNKTCTKQVIEEDLATSLPCEYSQNLLLCLVVG